MSDIATKSAEAEEAKTAPEPPPPRDVSQVHITDFERKEFPENVSGREKRFQAVIRQSVLNQIHRHGQSVKDIEICGVLVGNVFHDADGPWLYIQNIIEGNHATQRAAQVTFTAETWTHIQAVMDRDHQGCRILGWYHTHPGFGIFLSDMDVFIQENFFSEAWQVAFVYDPNAKEEGLFLWKNGKPDTDRFLVEGDAAVEDPTRAVKTAKDVSGRPMGQMAGDLAQFGERLEAIEKRQKLILALLAIIGVVALAWPLAMTAFLPDLMQKYKSTPPPPVSLPSDDPTNRSSRF